MRLDGNPCMGGYIKVDMAFDPLVVIIHREYREIMAEG